MMIPDTSSLLPKTRKIIKYCNMHIELEYLPKLDAGKNNSKLSSKKTNLLLLNLPSNVCFKYVIKKHKKSK